MGEKSGQKKAKREKHNKQQIAGEESQKGRLPASSKMPRKMKNKYQKMQLKFLGRKQK